jgi:hypothetical protein
MRIAQLSAIHKDNLFSLLLTAVQVVKMSFNLFEYCISELLEVLWCEVSYEK